MKTVDFQEPIKKGFGTILSRLSPLYGLEMLVRNARLQREVRWAPPSIDGTLIREVLEASR